LRSHVQDQLPRGERHAAQNDTEAHHLHPVPDDRSSDGCASISK
jgi:hypothetical protein